MKKSEKALDIVLLCLMTFNMITSLIWLHDGNYAKANNDLMWAVLLSIPLYASVREARE